MKIRKATAEDEMQIIKLLGEFPPTDQVTTGYHTISATFHQLIDNSQLGSMLVAEEEGNIIGVITLSYPMAIRCGGIYACVEEFIVAEQGRGKGVGGQLLKKAIVEAQKKGCYEIQVNNPSDLGYPIYIRHGLTTTGRHLRMHLARAAQ